MLLAAGIWWLLSVPPEGGSRPRGPEQRRAERVGLAGTAFEARVAKPDFTLRDTAGRPFEFRARTEGRLTLLFFGYTNCPDVCPLHLSKLAAGLRAAAPEVRDAVDVVFVGVDAPRDTAERVRAYLDHYDPGFVGLVGSEEELAVAQRAAMVATAAVEDRFEGGYTVSHSSFFFLYTPDGRARMRYEPATSAAQWTHDLAYLTQHGWPGA